MNEKKDAQPLINKIKNIFIHKNNPENNPETPVETIPEVESKYPLISKRVARSFVQDAVNAVVELEKLYDGGVFEAEQLKHFVVLIHGMKSVLAIVQETELSKEAKKLEFAGRDKDIGMISSGLPVFLTQLKATIVKFEAYHVEDDEKDINEADVDYPYLHQHLIYIIDACHIYDKKTIKHGLNGLMQKTWPLAVKEKLHLMSDYLLSGDFQDVSQTAKKILNKNE